MIPADRIVVGGVDLFDEFGFYLTSGSSFSPPEPKVYQIDVPGGDGCIDATESLFGDVAYSNRRMTLALNHWEGCGEAFASSLSRLVGFLHGRRLAFELSWDPGSTYTGRFAVGAHGKRLLGSDLEVEVDADPYRDRGHRTVRLAAGGGAVAVLECGRKRQRPRVTCESECEVSFGGETVRVQPGSWRLPGLWLAEGPNEVYANTMPFGGDTPWSDYADAAFSDRAGDRWGDLAWSFRPADSEDLAVYFDYDVMDL